MQNKTKFEGIYVQVGAYKRGGAYNLCYYVGIKKNIYCFFNLTLLTLILLGKADDKTGCLKSVMAIYLFRKMVADLKQDGLDFSESLVVPEVDVATGEKLHQREDHNHLLKRIVGCIREGKIPGFNVVFLRDALHDAGNVLLISL